MGTIEQLILDVRAWVHLLVDSVELPSQTPERQSTGTVVAPPGRGTAARLDSHPPQAA